MPDLFGRAECCDLCVSPAFWKFSNGFDEPIRLCEEHLVWMIKVSLGFAISHDKDLIEFLKKTIKEKGKELSKSNE